MTPLALVAALSLSSPARTSSFMLRILYIASAISSRIIAACCAVSDTVNSILKGKSVFVPRIVCAKGHSLPPQTGFARDLLVDSGLARRLELMDESVVAALELISEFAFVLGGLRVEIESVNEAPDTSWLNAPG